MMPTLAAPSPKLEGERLRFVRFAPLESWAYDSIFSPRKSEPSFATVTLGELIVQRKGFIRIDDSKNYKRCRVQLRAQGVVLRDEVSGTKIKTKNQQVCRKGDFLVAEIDAKLGGFGIVPAELDGAVVSSHYFLFEIDESRLSRSFLALCLTTDYFQQQVKATGSTNYAAIRPHHVLEYRIPLPSLAQQQKIVAAHQKAIDKAEAAEARARVMDQQVVRFLEESLGLNPRAEKARLDSCKLHFARFANLERWGDIFHGPSEVQTDSKFPMVKLRDVIADLQNGWSPKCHDRPAAPDEWGVLKLGAVSFGEYNQKANKALPENLAPTPQYEIKQNDVLISRANITQYVGACVHVDSTRPNLILCDKIFRVIFLSKSPVTARFLAAVMKIHPVRVQIEKSLTGTSPTMKNISKPALLNLQFPLPPITEQNRIVAELDRLRSEARAARSTAAACRKAAAMSLQAALFAP